VSTPSFTANLRGNFVTASNTLLTCPDNPSAHRQRIARRRGGRAAEQCAGRNNNDLDMRYVNADPSGHFNSSAATLTLPADARVVRAYLYWGADLARGVDNRNDASDGAPGGEVPDDPATPGSAPGTNTLWTTAKLRVGARPYVAVDATDALRNGQWSGVESWYSQPGNRPGFAYQVRANVTPEIRDAAAAARRRRARSGRLQKLLTVTVADVQAGRGYNRHAGWTLLVAWETTTGAWRNLTLYDGFAYVQVSGGQQLVVGPLDFTGFRTPAGGDVDAHAATWAYEGDTAITKDYLALGRSTDTCTDLKHMKDDLNPVDNFFNGTISTNGTDLGGRVPEYRNQLGFDRDRLFVPEGTIPNGATGASVCLGTTGDTYFFGGIAFDTLIRAPNLRIAKTASAQSADPGDLVTYSTEVTNPRRPEGETPTEPATGVIVDDPLPSGLDFVAFTSNPDGACSYDTATRIVHCNVGTLAPDGSFAFGYRARVSAAAQGTSPAALRNAACYRANSQDQPNTDFYGCDETSVTVPPNPYVDLGVVKTVSDRVVAPGATLTWTMVATNHGPGTSTGFVLADELPAGVAFVGHTASAPLTCSTPAPGAGGVVRCTAPSVPAAPAAGSSLTVTITGIVPAGTANGTVLRNVVTVNGDQLEPVPDPHSNRDLALTTVGTPQPPEPAPPDPDGPPAPPVDPPSGGALGEQAASTRLSLRKHASTGTPAPGDTVTYRLRVTNVGDASALDVRVCDRLPRGLTAVRARGFRARDGRLCRSVGRLAIGKARVMHITARVARRPPPVISNVAVARADNAPRVRSRSTIGGACPATASTPVAHIAC
jgi:large repetitive protein